MESKDVGSGGYAIKSVNFQDKVANNVTICFNRATIIPRVLTHITGQCGKNCHRFQAELKIVSGTPLKIDSWGMGRLRIKCTTVSQSTLCLQRKGYGDTLRIVCAKQHVKFTENNRYYSNEFHIVIIQTKEFNLDIFYEHVFFRTICSIWQDVNIRICKITLTKVSFAAFCYNPQCGHY